MLSRLCFRTCLVLLLLSGLPLALGVGIGEPKLNGGFEDWETLETVPPGWDLTDGLFPKNWTVEGRPGEHGLLRRVQTLPSEAAVHGQASLYLRGRILSTTAACVPRRSLVRVVLWARGEKGTLTARQRQYDEAACKTLGHLATFLEIHTGAGWQGYSAVFSIVDATFLKFDLEADGVEIDRLSLEPLAAQTQTPALFTIPGAVSGITVDGVIAPGEWRRAMGVSRAFVDSGSGYLVGRQADLFLAADQERFYLAVRTPQRSWPDTIREHDGPVYQDESFEFYFQPQPEVDSAARQLYQIVINPGGTIFDQHESPGKFETAWNCAGLQAVSKVANGFWTVEMSLPLSSVELAPGRSFGLNVGRNLQWPLEHVDLSGKPYRDLPSYPRCTIGTDAPAVQWGYEGELGAGRPRLWARVGNPTAGVIAGTGRLALEAETNLNHEFLLRLEPGAETEFSLPAPEQAVGSGRFCLELGQPGKPPWFRHSLPFSVADLARENVTDSGAGNRVVFYPLQEKLVLRVSNFPGLNADQFAAACASAELAVLHAGRELWRGRTAQVLPACGAREFAVPFTPPADGEYTVQALVYDEKGNCRSTVNDSFVTSPKPAWLGTRLGRERKVLAPFTPLQVKERTVSCRGREYDLAPTGFPSQIRAQGQPVLTGPVTLTMEDNRGTQVLPPAGEFTFTETAPDRIGFSAQSEFPSLAVRLTGTVEYDGLIGCRMELQPRGQPEVKRLSLEMPLRAIRYFHTSAHGRVPHIYIMERPVSGYVDPQVTTWDPEQGKAVPTDRAPAFYFPPGPGVIWSSAGIKQDNIVGGWLPYLWAGNHKYGLGWVADSDRGWVHDDSSTCQELLRQADGVTMRINFIAKPVALTGPRTIEFALVATPVRPRVTGADLALSLGYVAGFGSDPRQETFGARPQDPYIVQPLIVQRKRDKPARLYLDNIYIGLGDPDVRQWLPEWADEPPYEGAFDTTRFQFRSYGTDPLRHRYVRASPFPSRSDYLLWWLNRWMEQCAVDGLYLDDTFPMASGNCQQPGGGYVREDGRVQGAFHLFEQREFLKRTAAICQERQSRAPHIVLHMTGAMIPGIFSFGDLYLDGENDHKRTGRDFMDYWVLPRLEVSAAGAFGGTPAWLPLLGWGPKAERVKPSREVRGLCKLFDFWIWPGGGDWEKESGFDAADAEFGIAAPDCRFIGYWEDESPQLLGLPAGVKAGIYLRPGKGALVYVTNLLKTPQVVTPQFRLKQFGLLPYRLIDAETNKPLTDATVTVDAHDFRLLRVERDGAGKP